MKNIPKKILEYLINKSVSQAISRHVINKSVSQAIGRHMMGKNYKFLMEILKEKKMLKYNILFFYASFLRCYCIIFIFLTPVVVILLIKSP